MAVVEKCNTQVEKSKTNLYNTQGKIKKGQDACPASGRYALLDSSGILAENPLKNISCTVH